MPQASNTLMKEHPAKMLQTTRSLNEGADLDWYLAGAEREFPDEEDIDEALRKFIRANQTEGLFFLDEDNDRCKYGPSRLSISVELSRTDLLSYLSSAWILAWLPWSQTL